MAKTIGLAPAGFPRGTVILVALDPTSGHEQRGRRPCIVVSDPEITADQRYPLLSVVPVTKTLGIGALYPRIAEGSGGLRTDSCALVDQVRSIDKRRVIGAYGTIAAEELTSIDDGLRLFLGLG